MRGVVDLENAGFEEDREDHGTPSVEALYARIKELKERAEAAEREVAIVARTGLEWMDKAKLADSRLRRVVEMALEMAAKVTRDHWGAEAIRALDPEAIVKLVDKGEA